MFKHAVHTNPRRLATIPSERCGGGGHSSERVGVRAKEGGAYPVVQLGRQARAIPAARAQHQRQHPHAGARHVQHGPGVHVTIIGSQRQRRVSKLQKKRKNK